MSDLSADEVDRARIAAGQTTLIAGQTWRNWRSDRTIIEIMGEIIFYRTTSGEFWCSRDAWIDWMLCSGATLVPESATEPPRTHKRVPPVHKPDRA